MPEQDHMHNPFGMDESCQQCSTLVTCRTSVVHGYGDVTADFLVITERPTGPADRSGHALANQTDDPLIDLIDRLGFLDHTKNDSSGGPWLDNLYVTHLVRCRHPDRPPTDGEIETCADFLSAEIRTINPELLIPVGERPLRAIVEEFTTQNPSSLSINDVHATTLRGRGFEIVPSVGREAMTPDRTQSFLSTMSQLTERDYRQTKGRRQR